MVRSMTEPMVAAGAIRGMRASYCALAWATDSVFVAGTPVPMSSSAWICGSTVMDCQRAHGEMGVRAGEWRELREVRAHFVPHGRVQRCRQRRGAVEHNLVALHMVHPGPGEEAAPVDTRVYLDLPDAGKSRHDGRVAGNVVGVPGVQVIRLTFVGNQISAGLLAGRCTEYRVRHRIPPHQHRLLGCSSVR